MFITTIAFIGAFQAVDHIFVLTSGGPSDKSTVLLFYLWQQRFENLNIGKEPNLIEQLHRTPILDVLDSLNKLKCNTLMISHQLFNSFFTTLISEVGNLQA